MKITCYHCKQTQPIPVVSGRAVVAFRDSCANCGSDLHVCNNCSLHDAAAYHECRESSAEWVKDKERANRCEYFVAKESNSSGDQDRAAAASKAFDDLFKK